MDAGATASDNIDGNLTSEIVIVNSVNTSVIGSYTVTYNVADAAGNHAVEAVITVNVVAATTPPGDEEHDGEHDGKYDGEHRDEHHNENHNEHSNEHRDEHS